MHKEMHIVLYGNLDQNGVAFADRSKETLVMLPALTVPSPNIYFKPLAEELDTEYNVVIIESFGYGLSDMTETARTVENINREVYDALEVLGIDLGDTKTRNVLWEKVSYQRGTCTSDNGIYRLLHK